MTGEEVLAAYESIDRANADDPTSTVDSGGAIRPKALVQGERATYWISRLAVSPSAAVLLAARAHHLRRFDRPRSDYPEGRPGYLRWRKDAKEAHAAALTELLTPIGVPADVLDRAGQLIRRVGLGSDPETQLVEDAACLVFCETDLAPLLERIGPAKTADAVAKTAKKMSPEAIALIGEATPPGPAAAFLATLSA